MRLPHAVLKLLCVLYLSGVTPATDMDAPVVSWSWDSGPKSGDFQASVPHLMCVRDDMCVLSGHPSRTSVAVLTGRVDSNEWWDMDMGWTDSNSFPTGHRKLIDVLSHYP